MPSLPSFSLSSGWLTRIGGVLSGPLPLALRLLAGSSRSERSVRLRKTAAISSIAGSLITRAAWIAAGKASAKDPQLELVKGGDDIPASALANSDSEAANKGLGQHS